MARYSENRKQAWADDATPATALKRQGSQALLVKLAWVRGNFGSPGSVSGRAATGGCVNNK